MPDRDTNCSNGPRWINLEGRPEGCICELPDLNIACLLHGASGPDRPCSHPADLTRWNPRYQVIQCQKCGLAMLVTPGMEFYPVVYPVAEYERPTLDEFSEGEESQ